MTPGTLARRGISDAEAAAVMARRRRSRSPATLRAYLRQCRQWDDWLEGRGIDASPLALQVYLEDMLGSRGWSLATVRQAVAAIGDRDPQGIDATVAQYVASVARDIGLHQRQARPLLAAHLPQIEDCRDLALCRMMRDGLLRVSEAAAARWRDIDLQEGLITVPRSKGDQAGAGKTLYLGPPTVAALQEIRPRWATGGDLVWEVTASTLARRIARAARRAGLGDGYSGHSPRVGMAQDLAAAGVPMASLLEVGRWRTVATALRYVERQQAQRSAVAEWYRRRDV